MTDSVQFWLDNKMSTGLRVATIGDQTLVSYRDRFYVVAAGAAVSKGGKAQQFSKTSLPAIWKKALRGVLPASPPPTDPGETALLPRTTRTARERQQSATATVPPAPPVAAPTSPLSPVEPPGREAAPASNFSTPSPPAKAPSTKATSREPVRGAQESVSATCPYCGCQHNLELDKRKNGKPFFVTCTRCAADFGVRFVQVTVYQAQVAGFKPY